MSEKIVPDCPFPIYKASDKPRYLENPFLLEKADFELFCDKTKTHIKHFITVYQCYCILTVKYEEYINQRYKLFSNIILETNDDELANTLIKDYDEIHDDLIKLFEKFTSDYLEEYTRSPLDIGVNSGYRYEYLEKKLVDFCNKQKKITCDKDLSNFKHINLERKLFILNHGDKSLLNDAQYKKYQSLASGSVPIPY